MNSRMLIMGLAAVSMVGMGVNAQTCGSGTAAETAVPTQGTAVCAAAQQSCELFGGLRMLMACRTNAPCAVVRTCASCAAAETVETENAAAGEEAAIPAAAPENAYSIPGSAPQCTFCADDASADANFFVQPVNCVSCAAPETGNCLPMRNAPLACGMKKSVIGVRCMVSGLFGALAEAAATPPPCRPCVQAGCGCASCAEEAAVATDSVETSETSGSEQPELPESPEVKQ